ncbi:hypothetical protein CLF_101400 [Clonorchis sinensis]|uniref:DH domain-containing protein n=1 Tax=Clonorchis sinensis TaxID=79923 RepID=G7Y5N6_CLOSI|nr:hypothetical protein CLF_101400 [Clonorchis sinensis]
MVDANFFASDRKVGALDGFYFASFSVDSALRSGPPSQINLVEDQCVECLNADNPDCWVAKVHPVLNRSGSLQKRGRRDSALPDNSPAKDNQNEGAPTNGLCSSQTNGHSENERPGVGRVNSVCLTRILRGTAKGKRDPRELFREEVITISNKQQESKMKRRYALTELIETEREYVKALTPLLDALTRFGTRVTLHLGEATEETIDLPKPLQQCIRNMRDKLKKIIDFTEKTLLDELAACTMNPPSAAECFIRNTDLETNVRTGLRPDSAETKKGRLILLPQHILFLQKPEARDTWDIAWIMKLDGLRIGASELSDKQPPWFEIWITEGSDPTKKIVRIYCADTLSQNAWMEDIRRALMNLQHLFVKMYEQCYDQNEEWSEPKL